RGGHVWCRTPRSQGWAWPGQTRGHIGLNRCRSSRRRLGLAEQSETKHKRTEARQKRCFHSCPLGSKMQRECLLDSKKLCLARSTILLRGAWQLTDKL